MSALTKLFVVLLIVCSLLLTASTVVFVNRVDDYQTWANQERSAADNTRRELAAARAELALSKSAQESNSAHYSSDLANRQSEVTTLTAQATDLTKQVAVLQQEKAVAAANLAGAVAAAQQAQKNVDATGQRNQQLMTDMDTTRNRNAELAGANADLQKRLDQALQEVKVYSEQLGQAKQDAQSAQAKLEDVLSRIPGGLASAAAPTRTPPDVKGVIRAVKNQDGQTYATISLGSNQKVQKGMQFQVVDRANGPRWLGTFTVETVDTDSSFGRLEGPSVQQVKPDNLVLSRL